MDEDTEVVVREAPPTEPGFYKYTGGAQVMIFLLDAAGRQWWVVGDQPMLTTCEWGYIEQALGVWDLEKIT